MKRTCSILILLGILCAKTAAQFAPAPKPEGIWFKDADHFPKRFLYSQAILWPSSLAGHIGLYLSKDNFDWSRAVRPHIYKKTFTTWPQFDQDHWSWNYEVHPYMGSISYLTYRNRDAGIAESFLGSALNSVIYEYLIAGGTQPPSLNDLIVTPLAGSLAGEGLYRLKKVLIRDRYLSPFEKIILTIIDPVEVFYFGFNYQKITNYPYR